MTGVYAGAVRASVAVLAVISCSGAGLAQPAGGSALATDLPELAPIERGPAPPPATASPDPTPTPQPLPDLDLSPSGEPPTDALAQLDLSQFRFARVPNMMGDFFGPGLASSQATRFVGEAVHNITSINDIQLISRFGDGTRATFVGGPSGGVPGSFFVPPVDPPAPALIEGLVSDVPGMFFAERTEATIDAFNDETDTIAAIPDAAVFEVFEVIGVQVPVIGPGDLVGRVRVQDNNSAFPKDRVFFDYSYFKSARLSPNGVDVNRFSPGFEKTFADGLGSIEVRTPMSATLSSDLVSGGSDVKDYEFGNAAVILKLLLLSTDDWVFAGGFGVGTPTGDDLRIRMQNGDDLVTVSNEAVHLLPYLAAGWAPQGRSDFAHAFVTFDFDANGNQTLANFQGAGLEHAGVWHDQNLVTVNLAYGSNLYQAGSWRDRLQSLGWAAELHYTASLNDADVLTPGGFVLGDPNADLSVLNATIGGHARVGQTFFSAGYVTPLNSDERIFDGELRVIANRLF